MALPALHHPYPAGLTLLQTFSSPPALSRQSTHNDAGGTFSFAPYLLLRRLARPLCPLLCILRIHLPHRRLEPSGEQTGAVGAILEIGAAGDIETILRPQGKSKGAFSHSYMCPAGLVNEVWEASRIERKVGRPCARRCNA